MYGFIEVKDMAGTISVAVSQIQAVRSNTANGCTAIQCGESNYTTLETYDEIMRKIRAEIIWVLRSTKEESTNE